MAKEEKKTYTIRESDDGSTTTSTPSYSLELPEYSISNFPNKIGSSSPFEERRAKKEKIKEEIYKKAQKIISKDKMTIFDKAYEILDSPRLIIPEMLLIIADVYFEIITQLNEDDYSLDQIKRMYTGIKPKYTLQNFDLLRTIRDLSIHGRELYDALYDEDTEIEVREAMERYRLNFEIPSLTTRIELKNVRPSDRVCREARAETVEGFMLKRGERKESKKADN